MRSQHGRIGERPAVRTNAPCSPAVRVTPVAAAARLAKSRKGLPGATPIELWRQDEARISQQTKLTRRLGKARSPAVCSQGSAAGVGLNLWRMLSDVVTGDNIASDV